MPATLVQGWATRMTGVLRAALPQACALCTAPSGTALVCAECVAALPRLPRGCPCCALPSAHGSLCGSCLARPPAFDRSRAAFAYAFPLDRLVQAFKYHGVLAYADWFAEALLASHPVLPAADLMLAVPLARGRQRERGFNQALEIARTLARRTGIPLATGVAARVRDTPAQASLPWRDRAGNIRGAFSCTAEVAGRRVLVIDDVMTTGASLDELARTLKQAGAAEVENWLVARTLPPGG